jgi:hypothetical protein
MKRRKLVGSRVSIAEVMTLVFLAALDVRAIRSCLFQEGGTTDLLLSTGGMLMLNVLGVGLLFLRRKLRSRESAPFLMGFEIGGGLALLFYVGSSVLFPVLLLNHFKTVFAPLIAHMASSRIGRSGYFVTCLELLVMAYFTALLSGPALIAGWYARRRKRHVLARVPSWSSPGRGSETRTSGAN